MTPHAISIEKGSRFHEIEPRQSLPNGDSKQTSEITAADYGLFVGDLVVLSGRGLNSGGIVFRLVRDNPPVHNAIYNSWQNRYPPVHNAIYNSWQNRYKWRPETYTVSGWTYPGRKRKPTKRKVPNNRLRGCVELVPAWSFFPHKPGSHVISYRDRPKRVKKVTLVDLCTAFATFQLFIKDETKRLSGESST